MQIESPAFVHEQIIPKRYTCDGEDLSPPLHFKDLPAKTKSLVLIVDDPDAPVGTFDHWLVWDIPPSTLDVKEGAKMSHQGTNGFGTQKYRGPCPPKGRAHRYFFKLYALDSLLNLPEGSSKTDLEEAMEGHVLGKTHLIGRYQRS
jgi:Raf kinase inhibitor-like YbhB/YbcL family protein